MSGPADAPRTALVTGATAGIGLALVSRLAAAGYRPIACGRRPAAAVTHLFPEGTAYLEADLGDPAGAAAQVAAGLDGLGLARLDRLVLNAGVGRYGDPRAETAADMRLAVAVNLTAPILLLHELAPRLAAAGGTVTLIGSVARRGTPRAATYAATKAGLDGLARSLAAEWDGRIGVQIIHPGPVATGMHERAGYDPGRLARLFLTPQEAAAGILRRMEAGRRRTTMSFGAKARAALWRIVP